MSISDLVTPLVPIAFVAGLLIGTIIEHLNKHGLSDPLPPGSIPDRHGAVATPLAYGMSARLAGSFRRRMLDADWHKHSHDSLEREVYTAFDAITPDPYR